MNVLISGGGRTGARLANLLLNQDYKVRLIENRRELLGYLHQELPTRWTQVSWKRPGSVKYMPWLQ